MLNSRLLKILLLVVSPLAVQLASVTPTVNAEIIDLDTSAVDPRFVNAFQRAEAFWDARILGYSSNLPREVQAQLTGRLTIVASTADLGANIIGQAGPTQIRNVVRGNLFRRRSYVVATAAIMQFDNAFLASGTEDEITDVIIHEMGHALGFGGLWASNGLLAEFGGVIQYVGVHGRRAFSAEAGLGPVPFVPIEQQGGAGTALAHWEDAFGLFKSGNRVELLTGFFIPNTERFISQTTLGSFVDLHYVVAGFNESELLQLPLQGAGTNGFPKKSAVAASPTAAFKSQGAAANLQRTVGGGIGRRFER